jgi:hypothetical protein
MAEAKAVISAEEVNKRLSPILEEALNKRDKDQVEFKEAVSEVLESLVPLFQRYPEFIDAIPSIIEPDRAIIFRVPWIDDQGVQRVNRGFRVQFNQAIGPYKGGLVRARLCLLVPPSFSPLSVSTQPSIFPSSNSSALNKRSKML